MPLVPLSTINEWYYTDSWVYRSFKYMYQNQLWDHTPPKGRSVCVYFWSAVLSLIFLRPLIGFALLLKWVVGEKVAGFITPADAWMCKQLTKLGIFTRSGTTVPGACILVPIAVASTVAFAIGVVWMFAMLVQNFAGIGAAPGEAAQWLGGLPQVVLPIFLMAVLIKCTHYASVNDDGDRCPVEWYSRGATVGALALVTWLRPSESAYILRGAGDFLAWAFGGIAHGLAVAALWFVHSIGNIWHWFFSGLGGGSWIWIAGVVAAFALFSAISYRVYMPSKPRGRVERTIDEWLEHLIDVLCGNMHFCVCENGQCTGTYVPPKKGKWRRFANLNLVGKLMTYLLSHREDPIGHKDFAKLVKEVRAQWVEEEKRRIAAAKRRVEACKRFTSMIDRALSPLWKPVVWAFTQLAALWTTTVSIAKAKKSGACPYIEFKERS